MKRYFRPLSYSVIAVLAALAIFGEAPADLPHAVEPSRRATEPQSASSSARTLPLIEDRPELALSSNLFGIDPERAPAPAQVMLPPVEAAPPAEILVLGWMLSGSGTKPQVFVSWNNDHYTLSPSESVGDTYRFDQIGGGFADFTYLPTGEPRQYAVSDPAVIE